MLQIVVPSREFWDEKKEEFILTKEYTLLMEHSLISISKWESIYHKPFLDKKEKTQEELMDYIKFMTITQNVPDEVYLYLTEQNIKDITDYIQDKRTATWFSDKENGPKGRSQTITSELIYYWMVALQIPWDAERWHLNRLLTLVTVCNEMNKPKKKMSKSSILKRNASLNEERLRRLGTSG